MKQQNGYPKHIQDATQEIKNKGSYFDYCIVMLDARCPISCLEALDLNFENKRKIILGINRSSLTNKNILHKAISNLKEMGFNVVDFDLKNSKDQKKINTGLNQLALNNKSSRICVAGVPNVGKSTFINLLKKRKSTKTENYPGTTKHLQGIKINDKVYILDTPGIFLKNILKINTHTLKGTNLLKLEIDDHAEVTTELINFLASYHRSNKFLYEIFPNQDGGTGEGDEFILNLGKRKNFLLNDGEIDFERSFNYFYQQLYKGKIGLFFYDKM